MENAGLAVVAAVEEKARELGGEPTIVVVAGKGNNGGDGLVTARHLHNHGHDVTVQLLARGDELKGSAAVNFTAARNYGVPINEDCSADELAVALAGADLVVDAVLGTGVSGEVRGKAREATEAINAADGPVVAVDLPSGVDADTGALCGVAVRADLTVTFGLPKVGNVVFPGAAHCGELRVADITLPPDRLADSTIATNLITPEYAAACLPPRWPDMHKGDAGRLLIVAGSRGFTGAAAMAALGALRAGAGLVYLAVPESLNAILETKCTEAITLPLPETAAGSLALAAAETLVPFAEQCDAVAVGPGLSRNSETAKLVRRLVAELDRPLVLDADGLNCLADTGPELLAEARGPVVITPHPGELSRLLGTSVEDLQADRLGVARRAAAQFKAVVLLKGAGTIIARPDAEAWINRTGSSALASGGTGDVLTGMIGAFASGGARVEEAAIAGAYYHGLAGELAAEALNERTVIASDLLNSLPKALSQSA